MEKFIPAARFHILNHFFDQICTLLGLGKSYRKELIKTLNLQEKPVTILDAGCGTGSLAIEIKQGNSNANICGIDINPKIIAIAKNKADKENLAINFIISSIQKLPCQELRVEDPQYVLKERA